MNLARLKMLEEFAHEAPDDPFNHYALALEYLAEEPQKAKRLFAHLLAHHPGYVPTYYHAGNLYWETGEPDRALEILRAGLVTAKAAGDRKAAGELQGLLDMLDHN